MIGKMYTRIYTKLQNNVALRNNDRLLILNIWRDEGLHLTPEQEQKFMKVSSAETIRRTRQKVQSDGYFLANTRTQAIREEQQYQVKSEVMQDRMTGKAISWLKD